jgi:hypothetical protein
MNFASHHLKASNEDYALRFWLHVLPESCFAVYHIASHCWMLLDISFVVMQHRNTTRKIFASIKTSSCSVVFLLGEYLRGLN